MTTPEIDVRAKPGYERFSCPICGWSVVLTPAAAAAWTDEGTITPRCSRDDRDLDRAVYTIGGDLIRYGTQ
jgi:hypothetical protein